MKKNMNTQLLKKLYSIYSPSGKEQKMVRFLCSYINGLPGEISLEKDSFGNLYVTKGSGESYPCLVSHLDQVSHCRHSKDFRAVEAKGILFGYSPSKRRFENLGADDKNGIFICLECLRKYDVLKVVFFREEETGCRGSSRAYMPFFDDVRFVVQPDRKGNSDLITAISFTELCSGEFIREAAPERWGYAENNGLMTDVLTLKENGLEVSCANVSCGYYNAHTDEEITVKKDLQKCLDFVEHLIEDCTAVYVHQGQMHSMIPSSSARRRFTTFCTGTRPCHWKTSAACIPPLFRACLQRTGAGSTRITGWYGTMCRMTRLTTDSCPAMKQMHERTKGYTIKSNTGSTEPEVSPKNQ